MPYEYIEPDVFVEHQDVTVFHTYGDVPGEGPCEYWFTTNPENADGHNSAHFDARDFAPIKDKTVGEWNGWWKPRFLREREAIEALVCLAIERGAIVAHVPAQRSEIGA